MDNQKLAPPTYRTYNMNVLFMMTHLCIHSCICKSKDKSIYVVFIIHLWAVLIISLCKISNSRLINKI